MPVLSVRVGRMSGVRESARRRERELVAYYDREVQDRVGRDVAAARVARRTSYVELLEREKVRSVLEIGSGPGRDGLAFAAAGFDYVGVDLAPESVRVCRSLGLTAQVASVLEKTTRGASDIRSSSPVGDSGAAPWTVSR